MSHLDTAYQLGVKQAEEDFQVELQKAAQGVGAQRQMTTSKGTAPQPYTPGSTPIPAPKAAPVGSPAEAVRGSQASGLARSTRAGARGVPAGI